MGGEFKPWGWGSAGEQYSRPRLDRLLRHLRARGIEGREAQAAPALPSAPASRLTQEDLEALGEIAEVRTEEEDRIAHSVGKSYLDLLAFRVGLPLEVTDAVARPSNVEDVRQVVAWAVDEGIALIPFGGGTSVLGGLRPLRGNHRAVVTVDLRRLNRVLEIDETSLLVVAQAGILGPELEKMLQARGFTLGHYPQSFHFSSLGGWIATRSSGHLSGKYGRIEDMVQALRLITPEGEIETRSVPARSTGPEFREMILGSEGFLGIIVEAVLRIHRKPEATERRVVLFPDFPGATEVCRQMVQAGIVPALVRIADEEEAATILAVAGQEVEDVPSLVLLGFEGPGSEVESGMQRALDHWTERGGMELDSEAAALWEEEYYRTPYLRDELMDRGFLVETLETAAGWSALRNLYRDVRGALHNVFAEHGIEGLVLCHLSHAYRDGASLYFTVLGSQLRGHEAAQWGVLKEAAMKAIFRWGTLSHHHGIGLDHRAWMREEHGEAALKALAGLKKALDPSGIMNPGKLLEEER